MIQIQVEDNTPELMQKLEAAVSRFVRKSALYLEGELKSSMAEPKSGAEYGRGANGLHTASAAGESPAVDSSNYIGSIQTIIENSLEAKVGTPVEYALYLEEGTSDIAPRPLWSHTVEEVLPTLETMLASEISSIQ